ncbi:poxvirus late transcription factor VLTF3 like-domain-containing protein [Tribonema minus]|uniref:Poxvirus late transcription factor VLTF3 like-domain-containing protein n=1 Tax=Tribonema minus TaxID=303371 RepID=A0A835Z3I5_9STRA|nr:poxvirus late transcription factor VLTF3 like-domain-containing protein [Tribonema minus]
MFPQVFAWAHAKCKKNPDAKFVKRMKIPSNVNCSLNNFIIVSAPKTTEEDLEDAVNQDDDAYCELCNTVKQFDARTAQAICLTCGLSSTYMVPDTSYREGVSIHSPYLYKRINHCRDHLHRITGRESTQIEPEVIERISSELAKTHRPEELCNVTQTDIRLLLKRLGLSRLYNHTTRIWALTTGGKPLVLTQTQEQELLHLFNLIQVPWEKLRPKNRKNFLSYSYLLHKLSLLLGYTDVASHFKLLKSKEKVHFQDLYWQKICAAMGFRFERSVY